MHTRKARTHTHSSSIFLRVDFIQTNGGGIVFNRRRPLSFVAALLDDEYWCIGEMFVCGVLLDTPTYCYGSVAHINL